MIVSRFTTLIHHFVICCDQVTNFSARSTASQVHLLQGALVILVRTQTSQFWIFSSVKVNTLLPGCHLRRTFPNLSHEKCLRVLALLYLRDRLWTPLTTPEGLGSCFSMPNCNRPFLFMFWVFGESRQFPGERVRHFAVMLYFQMYLTSPAVAMLKTNWHQKLTAIQGLHEGRSRNRSLLAWLLSFFKKICGGPLRSPDAWSWVSTLRSLAGLEKVLDESCGNDVQDELKLELERQPCDNNRNEIFCLAHNPFPLFGQMWLLTTGPLIGVSVFFSEHSQVMELQACPRVVALSRRVQDRRHTLVLPR